ncbi:uncharacterized protein LOC108698616 [Xenopus laevis]|uniref:Uncharacterized protein LOC108698616 n=2 Tax=Xenopus laevis TaxID=8355 RepID=A0A1L8F8V6_XENLA|nr:uncharacterized protein LOC108698616 [Xenopus laevis]XP_018085724.1 uncharacterized protein LOC108698616 [Xenopus laevis]OCT68015.1 hypothetical protein XELAEV_18039311mg [Xenopus laevis]
METVTDMEVSLSGDTGEAEEIQTKENKEDESSEQWGEYQGTWGRGIEIETCWCKSGLHGCCEDRWTTFIDVNTKESELVTELTQMPKQNERWWCEDNTRPCERSTKHSTDKSSLQRIFENCFPPFAHPVVEEKPTPLELPTSGKSHTQNRSVEQLWDTACSRGRQCDQYYKWEGSKLQSSYLSMLHIKPKNVEVQSARCLTNTHKVKSIVTSPVPSEKIQSQKVSTVVRQEPDLKLMKVASVSVHVSGFSPSHHLQSLFQHWTQPKGKARLTVDYNFNPSVLV